MGKHEPTFNCLQDNSCTEWHLSANGKPVPITAFKAVAKFSENNQSNFEGDLIDMILQKEL